MPMAKWSTSTSTGMTSRTINITIAKGHISCVTRTPIGPTSIIVIRIEKNQPGKIPG